MNLPVSYWLGLLLASLIVILISWISPSTNWILIPLLILLFRIWKVKIKRNEIVIDERDERVWKESTLRTFQTLIIIMAVEAVVVDGCKRLITFDIALATVLYFALMVYYYKKYG